MNEHADERYEEEDARFKSVTTVNAIIVVAFMIIMALLFFFFVYGTRIHEKNIIIAPPENYEMEMLKGQTPAGGSSSRKGLDREQEDALDLPRNVLICRERVHLRSVRTRRSRVNIAGCRPCLLSYLTSMV